MPKSLTLETEAAIYVIFFQHTDFVDYINSTNLGKPMDIETCIPALTEVKPPHRIFLDLECVLNYIHEKRTDWGELNDEVKDNIIIEFLIININHEFLHKIIFEAPEIHDSIEKASYILNDAANDVMEHIIAEIERD